MFQSMDRWLLSHAHPTLKDCLCGNGVLRMRLFTLRSVTGSQRAPASVRSVDGYIEESANNLVTSLSYRLCS